MKIAVTGHRTLFGHYYAPRVPAPIWQTVAAHLAEALTALTTIRPDDEEVVCITGMAIGVDQCFANVALDLGHIVHAFIPCLHQESQWPARVQAEYSMLLDRITDTGGHITFVSNSTYTSNCMQLRNEAMVNAADHLIAVWDGHHGGGTYNCLEYAIRHWYETSSLDHGINRWVTDSPRITWIDPTTL